MIEHIANPFQGIDVFIPQNMHDIFKRYCQTGSNMPIVQSPFRRMIDLWFFSTCIAYRRGLQPKEFDKSAVVKIIDGSIFSSDPWRIHMLMLIAVDHSEDIQIVSSPRDIITLASKLSVAGLPAVVEMLQEGKDSPIWNLSDEIQSMLNPS